MKGQFPAAIQLSSLNGQNGFKLYGENHGDRSGLSVSAAGDINGDGHADLLIGAPDYANASTRGRSYVVFGDPGVGSSGDILLSNLTGANGFKLDGENSDDNSGWSVSAAGDINGDGHADLLIGAFGYPSVARRGRSYVVFGGPGVGSSGDILLSSLSGANGFKLDGENAQDYSGWSVSAAGDINGDGHADLLIGARGYPAGSYKGRSYVVFGGPGVGSSGDILLSNLTGANGFKLDGENNGDGSGNSVSAVGDINGDGNNDLLIAAAGHAGSTGRSYVVFGGPGVGSSGDILLSSLNGINGFKLDGENSGDNSGCTVSTAGDINGDGHPDLLIGANGYPNSTYRGRSYVVFGGPGVGSNGDILLSSLNGSNGFKLDGENNNDYSGFPVSAAGDINGDGYADLLIGATYYPNGTAKGRSYVVFGGPGVGGSGNLLLSNLNGTNGFKLDGENNNDLIGYSFGAAGDINGDGIADLVIGAYGYPNGTDKGRTYVVFGDAPPVLVNNKLNIVAGASVLLSYGNLGAYDRNHNNQTLIFAPTGIAHGYFSAISAPSIPLVNFTQQQVTNGTVQFVHDGTQNPPGYNMSVYSTGIAWTGPWPAQISFNLAQSYFPTILSLGSLNGQTGFKLDGENNGDESGYSVSAAGDINGDGNNDLLIGAEGYPAGSSKGRSYVVYGGLGVGSSGDILLSSLTGANGFNLDGENDNDGSGGSVSAAGDINGDGNNDLLIGASGYPAGSDKGRSYVVFGGPGVGSSGDILLSSLTGANGFKLDGENNNDYSGFSVSAAGDINGDGNNDLLIGAYGYPADSRKGRSYVMFGGPGVGSSGDILLSSLTGTNGFKLDGNNSDYSGFPVSAAGDINGDGYVDLLIGANGYPAGNGTGRSYVVFGGPGVGGSGDILLSSLNGTNGFKLNGENNNDHSGRFISAAGDINGDGNNDLLIGALGYPAGSSKGRSYVVFGGLGVGSSGDILLSSLNGTNGFKLDGENNGDFSGQSVSAAGDINGDGYTDILIGAPYYPAESAKGRSYVVFGGPGVGGSGDILLSSLNGTNGFKLDGENNQDFSGYSVSAAGDINGDGIADLLIGAFAYPNYTAKGRSYVVFGDVPPVLVNNSLSLSPGDKIVLQSSHLGAYDRNHNNNTLVFVPGNISHGYFSALGAPTIPLMNFTQSQMTNGSIQFVHDGSAFAPGYEMTVRSQGIAWTGPATANITFITSTPSSTPASTPTPSSTVVTTSTSLSTPTPTSTPVSATPTQTPTSTSSVSPIILLENQLTLSNDQTVVLSTSSLQASEAGFNNSQLTFTVGNVQNGYFATVPSGNSPSKNLTSFTQAQIQSGAVEFVHDGDDQAPGYSVLVSDGVQTTLPSAAMVYFAGAPIITRNQLNITVGGVITLTPALLNVTVTDGSTPNQVVLTVSNLQHAVITSKVTEMPINNFTLAEIQAGDIEVTQDGKLITPGYTLIAQSATGQSSAPNQALVYFSNQGVYAPQLVNNYLSVTQGESTVLSTRYLSAQQPSTGQVLDNATMFYVSDIQYGHFSLTSQPQTWISSFSQQQLLESQVQFVQDGSPSIPGYLTEAEASNLFSATLPANIFFTPVNEPSTAQGGGDSGYTTIQKAIISAVVSGTIGLFFAVLQICLKRAANKKLSQALGEGTDDYDLTVVRPVAKEIASRLKVTGFMNHTTNKDMTNFKSAVRSILFELDKHGVDLNFAEMKAPARDGLINEIARQTQNNCA